MLRFAWRILQFRADFVHESNGNALLRQSNMGIGTIVPDSQSEVHPKLTSRAGEGFVNKKTAVGGSANRRCENWKFPTPYL